MAYLIDPIGIGGTPVIRGFNHYKVEQGQYLDVCKPYEYMRERPDILYIGASIMYVGFDPVCKEHPEKKVYSMGLSSLSLPDMREYLRFVYKVHKPEIIYIGLGPFQFNFKSSNAQKRPGYSFERLERLAGNEWSRCEQLVKDSLGINSGVYWKTVKESVSNKKEGLLFVRGWDTERGAAIAPNQRLYYRDIGTFISYSLASLGCTPEDWGGARGIGLLANNCR